VELSLCFFGALAHISHFTLILIGCLGFALQRGAHEISRANQIRTAIHRMIASALVRLSRGAQAGANCVEQSRDVASRLQRAGQFPMHLPQLVQAVADFGVKLTDVAMMAQRAGMTTTNPEAAIS
jgi:hypothetical protein